MLGLLDELEAILRFVAEELGTDCYVNLMGRTTSRARSGGTANTTRSPGVFIARSTTERSTWSSNSGSA